MKQFALTVRLAILGGLLLIVLRPGTFAENKFAAGFDEGPMAPDSMSLRTGPASSQQTPDQTQTRDEVLAEASRLSLTVVKLFNEAKYDEALPLAKRALTLRETAVGPEHELVQGALLNLAELYTALRKYGEAQKILERLLTTHENKVGPEDPGAAIFLDKLAFLTYAQRDFKKSEAAYKRALAIREKSFGPNSAEVATSLFAMGEFYRFRGNFDEARPFIERAVLLRAKLLGRDNPEYLKTRDRYFCVAYESGMTNREQRIKEFTAKLGDSSPANNLEVLNGRALAMPRPEYPEEARRVRASGTVVVKVTIDEAGKVVEAADMCDGNPLLVGASIRAARVARFTPTMLSGKAVRVSGVITYNFVVR